MIKITERYISQQIWWAVLLVMCLFGLILIGYHIWYIKPHLRNIVYKTCEFETQLYKYNQTSNMYQYELASKGFIQGLKDGKYKWHCNETLEQPCIIFVEKEVCDIK